jgi:hypothetical protein
MMRQVLENIGAGGGNRTLVFSLEVSEYCSVFSGRSDIFRAFGPLRSLQNFSLSEWRLRAHVVLFTAPIDW